MQEKNIGGERLGSGNKMKVSMHGYQRSNHDIGFLFRTTMAPGTLVPFMTEIGLPGDTFDINLNANVKTTPTVGPLFGSFKLQLDVFACPMRLYNAALHNNKINLGMNIQNVKFPTVMLTAPNLDANNPVPVEMQQINQSSLLAYLGYRGLGFAKTEDTMMTRIFNALPILCYWDIFKNYYANKQEDNAYVIHATQPTLIGAILTVDDTEYELYPTPDVQPTINGGVFTVTGTNINSDNVFVTTDRFLTPVKVSFIWQTIYTSEDNDQIICSQPNFPEDTLTAISVPTQGVSLTPTLTSFPLENIDLMRDAILAATQSQALAIESVNGSAGYAPYKYQTAQVGGDIDGLMNAVFPQEGLAIKTYQSDVFNNWINTEWIDGENGIAAVTAVAITNDTFTIDQLNIAKKVYDMLNRIALAGGSYEDYLETVYDHETFWRAETPVYKGGLSKEIVFQEVVSTAEATEKNPLGTLAGKGILSDKHKGGFITIKVDEPSIIMGIVSITPRIDYSQGNAWYIHLKSLDDLHKPALDGIGFEDAVTEDFAFFGTSVDGNGNDVLVSAGKQPTWIKYMTNVNKTYGNFADPRNQMYMTLNRRYTCDFVNASNRIKDLTTYIDPSKFNYAFAQTDLSAMNFMVQIGIDNQARRKMSAKIIPNL